MFLLSKWQVTRVSNFPRQFLEAPNVANRKHTRLTPPSPPCFYQKAQEMPLNNVLSRFSHVWLFMTPWTVAPPPGSSVHGILQARILEWVAMPSSRDLPDPGIKNMSLTSCALAYRFFSTSTTWEAQYWYCSISTVSAEDWVNFIGQRDLNITKHRLIFSMT